MRVTCTVLFRYNLGTFPTFAVERQEYAVTTLTQPPFLGGSAGRAASRPGPARVHSLDAEIQTLGQGLMRLAQQGSGALPQVASEAPVPRLDLARTGGPAGLAFGRLIAAIAARSAVWGGNLLEVASSRLRTEATVTQPDAFFYTDLRTMNLVSHAIEERVIAQRLPCEVYAGFQRLALLKPQLPRYRALLDCASNVCVYGLDDTTNAPDVAALRHPRLIRFPIDRRLNTGMEWFWFVVVDHPHLRTALLAQHTAGDLFAPRQANRDYAGIWTFDATLVHDIVEALRAVGRTLYYGR